MQIDAGNASRLVPVCMFQMGEFGNFQTGPIVHRGVMYVTSPTVTVALDAATCLVKWRHSWEPKDDTLWNRNRGVAIKDGRVLRGTGDGYLLSLNAETGALLWARQVASPEDGETFTMPPTIFEDLMLLGPAGSENNMKGWVGAFRLSDGTPAWRFNTVPKAGEAGAETWKNPRQIPMGGGAVWTPFSLDAATGDLHVAVTNPAPDLPIHLEWNGPSYHPGTNLLYVPAVDWCGTFRAFEQVRHIPGKNYLGGTYQRDPVAKARGWITAVDAITGAITWRHQSPRPIVAAVTTTAGNVLFAGELTGDFVTLDARSGEVLYRFNTGGPMGGGVVTYEAGGRQYVAAASGSPSNFWVDRNPGSPTVVVFALPRP